jgi:hypothetical protein
MAASSVPINGAAYYTEVSTDGGSTYLKLGELTNCGFEGSHEVRETTDKYSGGNSEFASGKKAFTMSGEGNLAFAAEAGFAKPNDMFGYLNDRDELDIRFSTGNAGDYQFAAKGFVNSFALAAGNEGENATYSIGFQISGAVTPSVVS